MIPIGFDLIIVNILTNFGLVRTLHLKTSVMPLAWRVFRSLNDPSLDWGELLRVGSVQCRDSFHFISLRVC